MTVELSGLLSNPRVTLELKRIAEGLASEPRSAPAARLSARRAPQGQVLRAIKGVLAGCADGLQAHEVRTLVEQHLGRQISKSTVNATLFSNPAFELIAYGRYRLK